MFRRPTTLIGFAVYLIFGYLWGMLFSAHIFADLDQTHWHNIWVYVWLILWPFCLTWYFIFYVLGGALVIGILYLTYDHWSEKLRIWKQRRMRDKMKAKMQARRKYIA